MKGSGFYVVFATTLVLFTFSFSSPDTDFTSTIMATSRKLKDYPSTNVHNTGGVHLTDYAPVDPVPSSKAYIKPAPIEHGSPLIPYIPKDSPPPPPSDDADLPSTGVDYSGGSN